MKTLDLRLFEFAPTRTVFSQLLADPTIHMGFECELVTDIEESNINGRESPPDFDEMSWSQVENYVDISRRQRESIQEEYYDWMSKRANRWLNKNWSEQEDEYTLNWCIENGHLESKDDEDADDVVDNYRDEAKDEFFDDNREEADSETEGDMDEFIGDEYHGRNTRLMSQFDIYYETESEDEEIDASEVYNDMAYDLQKVVGKHVSTEAYSKDPEDWYVEEDGSLKGDGYVCAEVVSSVYQLGEGLNALNTIFEWMEERDYTTNDTTGLHVSFSIEDKDESDFDFLKMMILFDENYTANLFDRLNEYYAAQMRSVVFADMAGKGSDAIATLTERQMQDVITKLRQITANAFRGGAIGSSKYYSFRHRADGVVEFRSMGGQDYEKKYDLIRKRIVNMAYLMKVGCDPTMMAREYIARVYKMLTSMKYHNPRLGSGAMQVAVPFTLSSLKSVLDRDPEMAKQAVHSPYQFLANLGTSLVDRSVKLVPMQVRQLRFYVAKHKITADMFRNFFPNSDPLYNTIANIMRWPLVVPGDHDPTQQTLPFVRSGVDLSGQPEEPVEPYERSNSDQGVMQGVRSYTHNRLHD